MDHKPRLVLLVALASLAGCRWIPFPEKPRLAAGPVVGTLRLKGDARLASFTTTGIQNNQSVDLRRDLNVADRDFAIGGTITWGDGFAGVDANFIRWKQKAFDTSGTLTNDFGALRRNDKVNTEVLFNQVRLHYIAKVWEDSDLTDATLRFGVGAGLHSNYFRFESQNAAKPPVVQNIKFHDNGIPMLVGRAEAEWSPFKLRLQAGWSRGDWGDIDGTVLDLSAQIHYKVAKGVSAWVGYWRYEVPAKGNDRLRPFDFDLVLEGFMAGIGFQL